MVRNLIGEVRSRRVLAFAALGVLVVLALPLLFLKSAPEGAPAANAAAPAPAEEAKLPARAARLLDASDAAGSRGQATGSARDPLAPPASYRAALAAAAATGNGTAAAKSAPVSTPSPGAPAKIQQPPVTVTGPAGTATKSPSRSNGKRTTRALTASNAAVDIRFGKTRDTRIRRAIPRMKTFFIHGKLAAVFVKYSPSRRKAVFAVAPNVIVTGVKCRNQDGVCRYIDLAAGDYAWLTMVTPSRTIVNRRLDVVRVKRGARRSTGARAAAVRNENACLLRKLQAVRLGDVVERDACES